MNPDAENSPPESSPPTSPLATDTIADKVVRFGCGAILGALVVSFLLSSVMAGGVGLVIFAAVIVGACGVLAVAYGEGFVDGLLKVMKEL